MRPPQTTTTFRTIAAVAIAAVTALVGCSTVEQPDPPVGLGSTVTVAEVCASLSDFYSRGLGAVDLRSAPILSPDALVVYRAECTLVNNADGLSAGKYLLNHAPDRPDPTDGLTGYEQTLLDGRQVWIWDWRKNPGTGLQRVLLCTRVDVWNATLEIEVGHTRTTGGALDLTDDKLRRAIAYLTDYTTELTTHLPAE
ncbi:hypothetical protein ACWEKT_39955 [Nocardia takedensis]